MKINITNIESKGKTLDLSEKIFSGNINKKLIAHILYSQIANSKPRLAKTKQRNEITGSTAKIYAQKGTGNARHSSRKAPIFVGGGIAHGPKGGNNYKVRKLNRKEKKISLISILSEKVKQKKLFIFEDFKKKILKTKEFFNLLKKYNMKNSLFVLDDNSKNNIFFSSRNIPDIKITEPQYLNLFDIMKYEKIIFTISSVKKIEERLLKNE